MRPFTELLLFEYLITPPYDDDYHCHCRRCRRRCHRHSGRRRCRPINNILLPLLLLEL